VKWIPPLYISTIRILNKKPDNPIAGYLARLFEYRYLAIIESCQRNESVADIL
jgi:ribosomal protein S17E